ncbi:ATP-grasp domain-containing protein [uncultured Roseivirga sp.]|uniref:ATP-grasp domain-containing protein n=1 Tax=uncultured Roseivirga sp. TaxID=543088 RepID=UPI0030D904B3|tara:strand:- start:3268 stop:4314 length:1047 start_codon:yes stop_codon:yes gene_type:complete
MNKLNILVTGAGGGGIGEQIVKSLINGDNDYFIVCTDTRELSIASVIGDVFHVLPKASSPEYINELLLVCRKFEIKAVFPGSEPELIELVRNKEKLLEMGVKLPVNTADLISLCSDKIKFNDYLTNNGFVTCKTYLIDDGFEFADLTDYPYVIKPIKGSGSANVFIVQDIMELKSIITYLGSEHKFILQEYIGNLEEEYTVGILSTEDLGYVQHITLQRDLSLGLSIKQKVQNKTNRSDLGDYLGISTGISQGKFVENHLINDVVMRVVDLLQPTSSINMQCRVHNGEVYIFEINPRFSGTTNLRALVGFNEIEFIINRMFTRNNVVLNPDIWTNKVVYRGLKEYTIN